ncbi:hypothetical protein INS49_013043 [Diaporthe citri]|uniref:uncharacterized protein n=1 Tax=Diaporthe citri TaxID=83186 RepID=UPI001C7EC53E|nr:uncharacterized protein INS49_013043 [Diaporthe citri]KAG6359522.1 hypothetical protein INS49_013043 [Diaporthe citri]
MDPAAQQQADADRAALRAEAQACYLQMLQTTRCFDTFCNDMQAAVNELSQYDVTRYLDVTLKCDYLKDLMRTATNQTAMFFNRWQDHPSPVITRYHINQITLLLLQLRGHRNRIAELYLTRMDYDNPEPWDLEDNLNKHLTVLQDDVHRIFIFTGLQVRLTESDFEDAGLISKKSSPAPQEG